MNRRYRKPRPTATRPRPLAVALVAGCVAFVVDADSAQSASAGEPPSVEQMVEEFETVVFGSEIEGVRGARKVKKWKQPLRIAIKSFEETVTKFSDGNETRKIKQRRVKRRHFDFIQNHLDALVDLTGLKTEDIKKTGMPANITINFVPRFQMANPKLADVDRRLLERLAGEGGCYFLAWSDEASGVILKAVIVVNEERLINRISHCILEEMTQSLGLPNDTRAIWPSIFSSRSRVTELSRSDRILSKTLYDPRMRAGMPRAEAVEVARWIIAELDRSMP